MSNKFWFTLTLIVVIGFASACTAAPTATPTPEVNANMPNPASVYCEQNGGTLELRQDASGGTVGICVFPDGSECDEWAYFRSECAPQGLVETETPPPASTDFPTALPINPADYTGWWTYTHPVYGFTLQLPPDWVVDDTVAGAVLLNGHILMLHPQDSANDLVIRMTFRGVGEDILLWPTGVGAGDLIEQGALEVAGQPARRVLFVCPAGQVQSIYYHGQDGPNIPRGDLEFAFILTLNNHYCEEGFSLDGKNQLTGEMVIASLKMP